MFISKKHISRRAVLKGMGVTVSLPFLESMLPAQTPIGQTAAGNTPTRLACLEMVHGAAGSNKYGIEKNLWAPADEGADFDLTPSSLSPLEPFKDYLTIVSNTDCRNAEAFELGEVGADHFRTAAVFLTQAKPKMTEGSDVFAGTSIEQVYAHRFGQETPMPSLQLSIENLAQSGACSYGYSCVYTDSVSWGTPTDPLPMTRDPRVIFEQMFGDGITEEERATRREENRSILDWITREVARLKQDLGANDRNRLTEYLDDIREIERRIQKIEDFGSSAEFVGKTVFHRRLRRPRCSPSLKASLASSAVSAGVGDGERGLRRGLRAPGVGVRPKWVLEYSPSNKRIRYFVSITYVRTGLWTAHKFCGGGKISIPAATQENCRMLQVACPTIGKNTSS